jgi:hypothetical protein
MAHTLPAMIDRNGEFCRDVVILRVKTIYDHHSLLFQLIMRLSLLNSLFATSVCRRIHFFVFIETFRWRSQLSIQAMEKHDVLAKTVLAVDDLVD